MGYFILFLVGFGLAVSGGVTIIAYMNFLLAGISWLEYFFILIDRIEFIFLLVGFGLVVAFGVIIIAYMNFLPAGILWLEYFMFIKGRIECYFLPVGIIFMFIAIQRFSIKM